MASIKLISMNDKSMSNGMRDTSKTMLAKQARMEKMKNGYVTVVCPKCHEHPKITTTSRGERSIVRCNCGYIIDAEINF